MATHSGILACKMHHLLSVASTLSIKQNCCFVCLRSGAVFSPSHRDHGSKRIHNPAKAERFRQQYLDGMLMLKKRKSQNKSLWDVHPHPFPAKIVMLFLLLLLSRFSRVQLCATPTLCNPNSDGSPPGASVPGILQARILEWAAISVSNACMRAKSCQSCPILCDPLDSSPPGSSVHRSL